MAWFIPASYAIPGGLTLTRTASTSIVDGFVSETTESVEVPRVVAWYAGGRRDRFTGARVPDGVLALLTPVELRAAGTGTQGDRFTYNGETWEVQLTRYWEHSKNYYAEAVQVP